MICINPLKMKHYPPSMVFSPSHVPDIGAADACAAESTLSLNECKPAIIPSNSARYSKNVVANSTTFSCALDNGIPKETDCQLCLVLLNKNETEVR